MSQMSTTTEEPLPSNRKRKANPQESDRLTKRLSVLNLERDGSKLYVPVENPASSTPNSSGVGTSHQPNDADDDSMRLDDTKHKVYIYSIDDELSSDSDSDDGKLVFLPDIDKHLRETRIPKHILANDEGELAGMQLVLYSDPVSLSVPEDKDGVRKAILDSRRRLRDQQQQDRTGSTVGDTAKIQDLSKEPSSMTSSDDAMDVD